MNIVVVGQGAMGLLWYGKLSRLNHQITLKASTEGFSLDPILQLTETSGSNSRYILKDCVPKDFRNANIVIVAVKSYQVNDAMLQLHRYINKNCVVIYTHNGLLDEEVYYPPTYDNIPSMLLLTTHGCKKHTTHHIEHTGEGRSMLGWLKDTGSVAHEKLITSVLNQALPTVTWHDDIKTQQWSKLAINCVINPLTAIHDVDNGALCDEQYKEDISTIIAEVVAVAKTQGIALDASMLEAQAIATANATASNTSSMRADLLAGRKSEIDEINGAIVALAKGKKVSVKLNESLVAQVKAKENA
ncbi:ketopantoate reductase family protein [Thalassotalea agarivorans]|uniref:2-dehydropantoate 2-reductase n=1 Tax=Thalassotalea agarivorans TaxID=349064 RepID=A0A1I0AMI7_THASX|nr:2-dehydropantoate 2-reductase [Thalassotalea agarivorans]SES95474.1 2-dehydropantoate 2-reductase [Thalassotalea agarivorans]